MATAVDDTICFHCGDPCPSSPVVHDDKAFCCQGCRTVYQLLQENGLSGYYDLEKSGISGKEAPDSGKYAFLDDPAVQEKLLDFKDENAARLHLTLPNIHCSSCLFLLEHLYRIEPGIRQTIVDLGQKKADITYDPGRISLRQLAELLETIGYPPVIAAREEQAPLDRSLIYRLGVAGFCFGNIMLLSFPEYLGAAQEGGKAYLRFFSWLTLALSLPVFFYAAAIYFRSAWKSLRYGFINIDVPVSLGILALFGQSSFEIISGAGPGYMDSLAGLVFFLLIGRWVQDRTYRTLDFDRNGQGYLPLSGTLLTENGQQTLPIGDIEEGHRLLLRNGEMVPVDGILLSPEGQVDNSFITGESLPIELKKGDKVHAGGQWQGKAAEIVAEKPAEESYLHRLWNSQSFRKKRKSNIQGVADRVSRYFTPAVLVIATLTGIYWWWFDPSKAITTFTAVLIVACPCALALTVPFALGNMRHLFGKSSFYTKEAGVVEEMANITDVIFDKTGTLTEDLRQPIHEGPALSSEEQQAIATLASQSTHPLSQALSRNEAPQGLTPVTELEEVPGQGIRGMIGGQEVRIGKASWTGAETPAEDDQTRVWCSVDGVPKGSFWFRNVYRQGIRESIRGLRGNYALHLLSGDREGEARTLKDVFGPSVPLYFRQKPEDKVTYVEQLRKKGKGVMMVGDGLNDTGALRQSHVGIAVTDDLFKFTPASDVILKSDHMAGLDKFLKASRGTRTVIHISFAISLLYNLVGAGFAVSGMLTPLIAAILMPLSSVTVVGFITLATYGLARRNGISDAPSGR